MEKQRLPLFFGGKTTKRFREKSIVMPNVKLSTEVQFPSKYRA
jgi:hypothetical protein